jgi:hypothetical protein
MPIRYMSFYNLLNRVVKYISNASKIPLILCFRQNEGQNRRDEVGRMVMLKSKVR